MLTFSQWLMKESYLCSGMSFNADFWWDEPQEFLTTRGYKGMEAVLVGACRAAGVKITDNKLLSYQGQANPEYGYSYLVVLDQSHVMVHTWPENNLMNIDIFTCGNEGNPQTIAEILVRELRVPHVHKKQMRRGVRKDVENANEMPDRPEDLKPVTSTSQIAPAQLHP